MRTWVRTLSHASRASGCQLSLTDLWCVWPCGETEFLEKYDIKLLHFGINGNKVHALHSTLFRP
jgi:hypothetical protein